MSSKALSFLSKKSWHTSNLKNQKEVWLQEQEKIKEEKKLKELQEQLEEERELEKLRELQEQSGLIAPTDASKKNKAKLAWMYESASGPGEDDGKAREPTAEELVMGHFDFAKKEKQIASESTLQEPKPANEGRVSEDKADLPVLSTNEAFRRTHEDPLFAIRSHEKDRIEKALENPVKKRLIEERIRQLSKQEGETGNTKDKKSKKPKKERKRKRDRRRYSSDMDNAHSQKSTDYHHQRKNSSRKRSRSRSRSPSYDRHRRHCDQDGLSRSGSSTRRRHETGKEFSRYRSRSASSSRKYRERSGHHDSKSTRVYTFSPPRRRRDRNDDDHSESRERYRSGDRERHLPRRHRKREYESPSRGMHTVDSKEALSRCPGMRSLKEEALSSTRDHRTAEEKMRRLEEMMKLGATRESEHTRRAKLDAKEKQAIVVQSQTENEIPDFIVKAQIGQNVSLGDRINSRRHTSQRLDD